MALAGVAVPSLELIFEFLIIGIILFTLAGGLEALVDLWFVIKILRSDTLPIELVASTPGPVEISGTARVADEVVRAPFSDVECLACEYKITKARGTGDSSWDETIYEGRTHTRFYVEDDTASVLVDPAGATFNFEEHETRLQPIKLFNKNVPASLRQFLDEHPQYDIDASRWNRGTQTFIERRLEPGEQVHVYGIARYDPTVSKHAGTVNAIIDAPPPFSRSLLARFRSRVTTSPFVIYDTDEGTVLRRLLADAVFLLGLVVAITFIVFFLS